MNRSPLLSAVVVAFVGFASLPNAYADEPAAPPPADGAVVAAPAVVPPPDAGPSRRVVAIVAAGVGVVSLGVGTTFGVLALNTQSSFNAHPTAAAANTGNEQAVLCDAFLGAAVIAGVTSIVLLLTDEPPAAIAHSQPQARVVFAPVVSSHGAGAGALVRF